MAKTYDIRAKDLVALDELTDEDLHKLRKFVKNKGEKGYDLMDFVDGRVIKNPKTSLVVESVKRTEKTNTEFAILTLNSQGGESGIRFNIQTRYLKLINRKPKHPVTSIFA